MVQAEIDADNMNPIGSDNSQSFKPTQTKKGSLHGKISTPKSEKTLIADQKTASLITESPMPHVALNTKTSLRRPICPTGVRCEDSTFDETFYHPFSVQWEAESGSKRSVIISAGLNSRLRSQFVLCQESYDSYLRNYLKRKWQECTTTPDLFTIGEDFYALSREVFNVTHECFADAINQSSVLPFFCSRDPEDSVFGASGKWEDVEEKIVAGSGLPPFNPILSAKIVSSCEEGVKRARPYFRFFILPFDENGSLHEASKAEAFEGNIIATLNSGTLRLRHQRYFLNHDHFVGEVWKPMVPLALVVWLNEFYRILHPVPVDIEECLTLWAVENIGDSSVLDFRAISRAFPDRCRDADEKANVLCGWYN